MSIQKRLFNIFVNSFAISLNKITLESKLEEDLRIDPLSTDSVSLLFDIEKEFDVEIPNKEFLGVKTVGDILELLKKTIEKEKVKNETGTDSF